MYLHFYAGEIGMSCLRCQITSRWEMKWCIWIICVERMAETWESHILLCACLFLVSCERLKHRYVSAGDWLCRASEQTRWLCNTEAEEQGWHVHGIGAIWGPFLVAFNPLNPFFSSFYFPSLGLSLRLLHDLHSLRDRRTMFTWCSRKQ